MKLIQLNPKHRCKKCKTPLKFICNYVRDEDEREEIIQTKSFLKRMFCDMTWDYLVDNNRQYWECPKCKEEYLVDLRDEK